MAAQLRRTTNILSGAKPECCQGLQLVLITDDITPVRLEIEGERIAAEVVAALHAGKFLHQYVPLPSPPGPSGTSRCLF